ncbi:RSP_7527 family protein [Oceanomicrobium pacificus]|uniref:Uncharacterized protein n=1 Tax=Oceanomicrobium pacificus TaxID=2692916 RepID=A0A6B0TWD4_9RHOB|nr:hypothetical protein [Oceanomicrobium pacificus]MXU65474.1 hypothetical protein [Oceanomicrobium pacificus]
MTGPRTGDLDMSQYDFRVPDINEREAYIARAHEMRAEAVRDSFKALGRAMTAAIRSVATLFKRPTHA